jgi:imidazolonepropionase-like amidohydrolase
MKEMNPPAEPEESHIIALVGGRLIDGQGGQPLENAVVLIQGSEIMAAGSNNRITIPDTAERVNAKGLSILPGLIDTHFHSRDGVKLPIEYELQKGITSFRDPGHPFKYYMIPLLSKEILPRIFLCGGHLDGIAPIHRDQAIRVESVKHAKQAVNWHVDRGASAIKVYFMLPLEHIAAACEAAEERGVLVTSHLELVDADDAIRAGVRGIEHVTSFGTVLADPADAAHFKAEVLADPNSRRPMRPWLWSRIDLDNSPRLQPLLDLIVETGTFVSPTLGIFEARGGEKEATEEQVRGFETMMEFITHCHGAGAKIVVGSHTRSPFADTGYAFQREMELLVATGMTPLEVITAGTKNGSEFFGIEARLGTIEAGKTADLILIEGDPSEDIEAMRNVKRVMLNGTWVYEQ